MVLLPLLGTHISFPKNGGMIGCLEGNMSPYNMDKFGFPSLIKRIRIGLE